MEKENLIEYLQKNVVKNQCVYDNAECLAVLAKYFNRPPDSLKETQGGAELHWITPAAIVTVEICEHPF